MPRRIAYEPWLEPLIAAQDRLITRSQAARAGLTKHAIANRARYDGWHQLLPDVFLTHAGEPARRQLLLAALLWAGPESAIDSRDACRFHGLTAAPPLDNVVHVAVPATSGKRNTAFVRVRRTSATFAVVRTAQLRYVDPATAAISATRTMTSERAVLATLSDVLQRRLCTVDELLVAHVQGAPRNAGAADKAIAALSAGIRSAPEEDFRRLAEASKILPRLVYNGLLRLPGGQLVSPDALALDAGLVHETNGRAPHAREDRFEAMHERHELMTVAGLTVLHSTPRQMWADGRRVIGGVERCYLRLRGRDLPPGVVLLRGSADANAPAAG